MSIGEKFFANDFLDCEKELYYHFLPTFLPNTPVEFVLFRSVSLTYETKILIFMKQAAPKSYREGKEHEYFNFQWELSYLTQQL